MQLADKTILNILAKSCGGFLLIISSVVMVRHFSKVEYATFLQVMLIVNTIIGLAFLGIPQSIYYYYPRLLNRARFLAQSMALSLLIGFAGATIVFCLMNSFAHWLSNPQLSQYGLVASLMIFLRGSSLFREPILISHGALIIGSCLTLICDLIFYVPLIVGVCFSVSLPVLFKIILIACGLEFTIYVVIVFSLFIIENNNHFREVSVSTDLIDVKLKDQLLYALPIGVSSYLGVIGKQIDQYIVSVFFSPANFAVYSRGALRIPVLHSIQITINNIMMPQYVNAYRSGDINGFLDCFHHCIQKVAKVKYPVFAFLFAIAPSLITLLYTKDYIEATGILRTYLIYLLAGVTTYAIIPRASGRTGYIMHATVISISSNIILSLLLIWRCGPIGAAIATVISGVTMALYLLYRSSQILGVSIKEIFPWLYLAKLLTVTLLASFPIYCLEYFFHPDGITLAAVLLAYAIIFGYTYIFLMMRYRLISTDDMDILSRWLRIDVKLWLRKITLC